MTKTPVGVRGVLRAAAVPLAFLLMAGHASAQPTNDPEADIPITTARAPARTAIAAEDRDAVLGRGWRDSTDRAWITTGDENGFHVVVAPAAGGYEWRTVASLSEPGLPADQWIGNACLTASGKRAVVVYAPRTFTNEPELMQRGGFTAVVDLDSGAVRKLPVQSSLAYFNPSCGHGETAVLTQGGDDDLGRTRLLTLDARTGAVRDKIEVPGQLTSPVPTAQGIVAADSGGLVRVGPDGSRRVLAPAAGVPFKVAADADGGVVFMERVGADQARVNRVALPKGKGRAGRTTLATGPLTEVDVTSGKGGRVFVTGQAKREQRSALPRSVSVIGAAAGSRVSSNGDLVVESVRRTPGAVTVTATVAATRQTITLDASPAEPEHGAQGPTAGAVLSPAVATSRGVRIAGDPHDPADFAERTCSVPRGDPRNQAMQPKPRQVEWAVDQAVRGVLTVQRPANWKNLGMPAYTPQGLFPPRPLVGGGHVPAQVMLGVAAQESNLWQAARYAVPGVTSNPLIGNYFGLDIYNGTPADDWTINWADADCGYGVTQVTDGMRLPGKGQPTKPYDQQRAIALDFAANVAAGLQILQDKWNQTASAGLRVNNGDPAKIENWFFAVWAYNSGFHPNPGDGSPWGVGWLNNPVNPNYPANRKPFLEFTYEDAAHPQDWPYPEKVMGWAGHPVELIETPGNLVAGYRPAWWNGGSVNGPLNRQRVKPPVTQFCDASNDCVPGGSFLPDDPDVVGEPAGPCAHRNANGKYDLRCWYHQPTTWKEDCSYTCGNELLRFDPGYAYQEDATSYAPRCDLSGLPSGALIIDDVPDGTPSIRPGCGRPWTNAGTFQFTFKPDGGGAYPGKIDTHQIGGGFGGHFWFTHTRTAADEGGRLEVSASWKLNRAHTGPMAVMVALPDHGAHTRLARYVVKTARGDRERIVRQPGQGNRWVPIGAFMFDGVPEVTLSSVTPDGDGSEDIAFDAVAFVPIAGEYHEESVEAVALFDEDQNIDTAAPGWLGGPLADRQSLYDWAVAASNRVLAMPRCDSMVGDCLTPAVERAVRDWRADVDAAGTDPVNHPDGTSIARWIGFANSYADRPPTDQRPASFDDDARYKIRTKATVTFITDGSGHIVPGSEWVAYEHRTADTHLPEFVLDLFRAVAQDYAVWGIREPNLSYRMDDLNAHDGAWTSADPMRDGVLPGRAYAVVGKAPVLTDYAGAVTDTGASCVAALTTAGGSIGYRPMLSQSGPVDAMSAFSSALDGDNRVAQPVADLVEDVREMFFDSGLPPEASMFTEAAPIWQELNIRACADGSIRKVSNRPILRASWMPSQYLYHNGRAMDLDGGHSGSSAPVMTGNFHNFSALPDPNQEFPLWPNPFGPCDSATDRSGNPWDISPPSDAGTNPAAHFCLDRNLPGDPSHSS